MKRRAPKRVEELNYHHQHILTHSDVIGLWGEDGKDRPQHLSSSSSSSSSHRKKIIFHPDGNLDFYQHPPWISRKGNWKIRQEGGLEIELDPPPFSQLGNQICLPELIERNLLYCLRIEGFFYPKADQSCFTACDFKPAKFG